MRTGPVPTRLLDASAASASTKDWAEAGEHKHSVPERNLLFGGASRQGIGMRLQRSVFVVTERPFLVLLKCSRLKTHYIPLLLLSAQ